MLLVRHGGGTERRRISLPRGFSLDAIDSNTRYWIFNAIHHAASDARKNGEGQAANMFKSAFVDGRLKKRRLPAQGFTKVWIEDAPPEACKPWIGGVQVKTRTHETR